MRLPFLQAYAATFLMGAHQRCQIADSTLVTASPGPRDIGDNVLHVTQAGLGEVAQQRPDRLSFRVPTACPYP